MRRRRRGTGRLRCLLSAAAAGTAAATAGAAQAQAGEEAGLGGGGAGQEEGEDYESDQGGLELPSPSSAGWYYCICCCCWSWSWWWSSHNVLARVDRGLRAGLLLGAREKTGGGGWVPLCGRTTGSTLRCSVFVNAYVLCREGRVGIVGEVACGGLYGGMASQARLDSLFASASRFECAALALVTAAPQRPQTCPLPRHAIIARSASL